MCLMLLKFHWEKESEKWHTEKQKYYSGELPCQTKQPLKKTKTTVQEKRI